MSVPTSEDWSWTSCQRVPASGLTAPAISWDELLEIVAVGGYPPAVSRQSTARRDAWFQSYIATTLQRDIRDLSNIADITAVPRLLSIIASRAGSLLPPCHL